MSDRVAGGNKLAVVVSRSIVSFNWMMLYPGAAEVALALGDKLAIAAIIADMLLTLPIPKSHDDALRSGSVDILSRFRHVFWSSNGLTTGTTTIFSTIVVGEDEWPRIRNVRGRHSHFMFRYSVDWIVK